MEYNPETRNNLSINYKHIHKHMAQSKKKKKKKCQTSPLRDLLHAVKEGKLYILYSWKNIYIKTKNLTPTRHTYRSEDQRCVTAVFSFLRLCLWVCVPSCLFFGRWNKDKEITGGEV